MGSENPVAIVTGAARPWGLGRVTALGLAGKGMDIVIADIQDSWSQEAIDSIQAQTGSKASYIKTDVSRQMDVTNMVDKVMEEFGRIDVLANVAGVVSFHRIGEITDEAFDRTININLRGPLHTCQAVAPIMQKQGHGRIVNVASRSGYQPRPGLALYATSKAGLIMFGKVLALEMAPHNVVVVTVAPGYMVTAMGGDDGPSAEDFDAPGTGSPFGRGLRPEEVADVVIYAATSSSPALSGQVLHANGADYMV